MKKILCLILTILMVLSSFAVCLSVSAKGEDDIKERPDGIAQVIDPILRGMNTGFANNINERGYENINTLAAGNMVTPAGKTLLATDKDKLSSLDKILKDELTREVKDHPWLLQNYITDAQLQDFISYEVNENLKKYISYNPDDKMFGVTYDFLYSKDTNTFFWTFCRSKLETNPHIHEEEVAEAVADSRYSTCAMKGAYDACNEMLNDYRYAYGVEKDADKEIFADIIEEKVLVYNSYTKKNEVHYNYYYDFTKGTFSLMRANGNNQIINTLSKVWESKKSFTWKVDTLCGTKKAANENAIKIANFIGNLLYPNFVEIPSGTEIFTDNKSMKLYDFFVKVSEISGLATILQDNWCNANTFDVKDVMQAVGVNIDKYVLLDIETEKGEYMGARILTDMFKSFYNNPVLYVEQLIQKFCKSYNYSFQKAIEALFVLKYPSMAAKSRSGDYPHLDAYTGSELQSVDGLLQFIADCIYAENVDAGKSNATRFTFAPLPVNRIVNAPDADELHLYMLCYMDINRVCASVNEKNGTYVVNSTKINDFINKVVSAHDVSGIEKTAKVFRSLFLGELTTTDILSFHLGELTQSTVESFSTGFMGNIKNAIAMLVQKFTDAMDSFMNVLFGWTEGLIKPDGIFGGSAEK